MSCDLMRQSIYQGNQISDDWDCALVKDLAKINGQSVKKSDSLGEINYIDISSVNNRMITSFQNVDFSKAPSRARRKVKDKDILISSVRPNLKHFTILNNPPSNAIASTGFVVITAEKVDPYFLYYVLTTDRYTDYLTGIAENQTSAYPAFNPDVIANSVIYFPSIEKQKQISSVLKNLDQKIELNHQINHDLEEMAQAIFKSWFVNFEPFRDGEFVDSELGPIPKGWRVVELEKIVQISTKSIHPNNNPEINYEHYSIPAFDSNKYPVFDLGSDIKSNKYVVYNNSILVSKLNPTTKRVWMPLNITRNAICSTEFINYQPIIYNSYYFVYGILDSERFSKFMKSNTKGSTNSRQRVTPKETLNYKVAVPDNEKIIRDYCDLAEGIFRKIQLNLLEINELQSLRDTLLPKLMSGEIRV